MNGCGTCENNIRGHSFFLSGTFEFTESKQASNFTIDGDDSSKK